MNSSKTFWQTALGFSFLATLATLIASALRWQEIGVILTRSVWGAASILYLLTLAACVVLIFWMQKGGSGPARLFRALELNGLQGWGWRLLAAGMFTGILWLIPWLKFSYRIGEVVKKSTQDPVLTLILFYFGVWWLLLLAAASLKIAARTSWQAGFAAAALLLAAAYEIYQRWLPVTAYPFSLGWSEGSRYFYASLYFAQSLYGQNLPLSTLHPSRYLLQSLPFLFPSLGLEAHRAWQALLWLGMSALAAWAITRKAAGHSTQKGILFLLGMWLCLFFLRVGIYYHLMPMLILIALLVSPKHPWRSLAAVILASLWAGISRVNWFPVPAMLAAAIFLLEEEPLSWRSSLPRLAGFFVLGLASALAAQAAYIPLSGNVQNAAAFGSSFSSDLLWARLWPNELYPLGIVPGILLTAAPLLLGLPLLLRRLALEPWRLAALCAMLIVLLAGSLVVSVKIGGGGDLHNMDTFAALLSLIFVLALRQQPDAEKPLSLPWPLLAFAALLPLGLLLPLLSPREAYDLKWANQNLKQLQEVVQASPGPVLFINERQLPVFGLTQTPLIADYEAVTLMEMAMSGNQPYLEKFYADLRAHRFALIVAGKQNLGVKEEGAFAEENNVWNTRVAPYILCSYEPILTLEPGKSKVQIFAPRAQAGVCP